MLLVTLLKNEEKKGAELSTVPLHILGKLKNIQGKQKYRAESINMEKIAISRLLHLYL